MRASRRRRGGSVSRQTTAPSMDDALEVLEDLLTFARPYGVVQRDGLPPIEHLAITKAQALLDHARATQAHKPEAVPCES